MNHNSNKAIRMSSTSIIFVAFLFHLQLIQYISGYSSGAPRAACNSLFPRHDGVFSQSIPSTHRFEVSKAHKTYFAGEKIPIALTVENIDTDAGFKGFIIQVSVILVFLDLERIYISFENNDYVFLSTVG